MQNKSLTREKEWSTFWKIAFFPRRWCRNFWLRLHHFFALDINCLQHRRRISKFCQNCNFHFFSSRRTSPDDAQNLFCRLRRKFYTWYNRMQQLEKLHCETPSSRLHTGTSLKFCPLIEFSFKWNCSGF